MTARSHRTHAIFAMFAWLLLANAAWCSALMSSEPSETMTSEAVAEMAMDHAHHMMMDMGGQSAQGMDCDSSDAVCCPDTDVTSASPVSCETTPVFLWLSWLNTQLPEPQLVQSTQWCDPPPGSQYDPPLHLVNCSFLN